MQEPLWGQSPCEQWGQLLESLPVMLMARLRITPSVSRAISADGSVASEQ